MQKPDRHFLGGDDGRIALPANVESQFSAPPRPRKLLDQVRDVLRMNHYAARTEEAYTGWIRRFILYHGKKHPREMGALEVELFLTHLAVGENVSTSTQKQALNAPSGLSVYVVVLQLLHSRHLFATHLLENGCDIRRPPLVSRTLI